MENIIDDLNALVQAPLDSSSSELHKEFEELQIFSQGQSSLCSSASSSSSITSDDAIIEDDDDDYDIISDAASLLFGADFDDKDDVVKDDQCTTDGIMDDDRDASVTLLAVDPESERWNAYANSREMTPFQEKINALTVIPNPIFCLFYLLAGKWLSSEAITQAQDEILSPSTDRDWLAAADQFTLLSFWGPDAPRQCISHPLFPTLYAMPPLPVMAVAMGIIVHAPFSFIYHWHYTHRLPPGPPRINHWSRRMDQSFIHVCSAFMAYGTSGKWNFFWVNALFNLDCVYRQFKRRVHPRRNKIRIYISIIAYTLPILRRGETALFLKLWGILVLCAWLFAKYPIKGWSHSAFHLAAALIPPLLMQAASGLAASEESIRTAARCAILAGQQG